MLSLDVSSKRGSLHLIARGGHSARPFCIPAFWRVRALRWDSPTFAVWMKRREHRILPSAGRPHMAGAVGLATNFAHKESVKVGAIDPTEFRFEFTYR